MEPVPPFMSFPSSRSRTPCHYCAQPVNLIQTLRTVPRCISA